MVYFPNPKASIDGLEWSRYSSCFVQQFGSPTLASGQMEINCGEHEPHIGYIG
jgi:hypothetical protein